MNTILYKIFFIIIILIFIPIMIGITTILLICKPFVVIDGYIRRAIDAPN